MNIAIDVRQLTKVYRTYQKEPGFFGALKGLAHRRYQETVAARGVSLEVK
jgi:ABC-2 type transport system ATP-binding protein